LKNLIKIVFLLSVSTGFLHGNYPKGGEIVGKNIFGVMNNFKNEPMLVEARASIIKDSSFHTFLMVKEKELEQDFIISGLINDSGIGNIYITKTYLEDGKVTLFDTFNMDISSTKGLYKPHSFFKTNWNTLFISQGVVNSRLEKKFQDSFKAYFQDRKELVNSYNYGWTTEVVILNTSGLSKGINVFSMGRTFADKFFIKSDNKTIYMYDSKNSKFVYKFLSETPKDFTKGTLFIGKKENGKLSWIKLGKNSALKIKMKFRKAVKFKDIFTYKKPINNQCSRGYSYISTMYGQECLKVKKRFKNYAGAFEPIRYGAIKGGTKISEKDFNSITKGEI
jgi:hypothetical protein